MDQVKIGDRVNIDGYGKFNVLTIEAASPSRSMKDGIETVHESLTIAGKTMGFTASLDYQIKLVLKPAKHNANRTAALDYQETLTKTGTQRKRAKQEATA